MKLIDADVAVKIAERYGLSCGSVIGKHSGIADVLASEIDSIEPVDPVHAAGGVYCRECVYFVPEQVHKNDGTIRDCKPGEHFVALSEGIVFGAHCGRFDSVTTHGYMDAKNCEIGNLYLVSRKVNFMMAKNGWYQPDRDLTLTAIKWCELFYAMKGAKS